MVHIGYTGISGDWHDAIYKCAEKSQLEEYYPVKSDYVKFEYFGVNIESGTFLFVINVADDTLLGIASYESGGIEKINKRLIEIGGFDESATVIPEELLMPVFAKAVDNYFSYISKAMKAVKSVKIDKTIYRIGK